MKKLFLALISILLLAGVAQAAEMGQAITADYSAQNKGRACTTDSCVIIQLWTTSTTLQNAGAGVSNNSILMIYTDVRTPAGITLPTSHNSAYDTVGEIVDYINTNFASDSSVLINARVGPDGYRSMPANSLDTQDIEILTANPSDSGIAAGNSRIMSAGVVGKSGVVPRIKSLTTSLPIHNANVIKLSVYDGDTKIWGKNVTQAIYNTTNADDASGSTVIFPEGKGISATKGNNIVAVAEVDANVDSDTVAKALNNISIIYDELRD